VLKVTPAKASANAASTRIAGEAKLWHRRFNHLGIENVKRAAEMVDGMPVAAWPHEGHLDFTADGAIKWKAHRRTRR